jgi:hypothetical protein
LLKEKKQKKKQKKNPEKYKKNLKINKFKTSIFTP